MVSVLITVECDGDSGSSDNDAGGDDCDTFCCVKYVLVSCACELQHYFGDFQRLPFPTFLCVTRELIVLARLPVHKVPKLFCGPTCAVHFH